jgi:hypothetical protein
VRYQKGREMDTLVDQLLKEYDELKQLDETVLDGDRYTEQYLRVGKLVQSHPRVLVDLLRSRRLHPNDELRLLAMLHPQGDVKKQNNLHLWEIFAELRTYSEELSLPVQKKLDWYQKTQYY